MRPQHSTERPPVKQFEVRQIRIREPNFIDVALENAITFLAKLTRQLAITLAVTSLKAFAAHLASKAEKGVADVINNPDRATSTMDNHRRTFSNNDESYYTRHSNRGSYYSSGDSSGFPGFGTH